MKKLLIGILIAMGAFVLVLVVNLVLFNVFATRVSDGSSIAGSGAEATALLVIDIQEGTTGSVSPRESYVQQAERLISNTNRCIDAATEKGWKVIYIRSEVVNPLLNLLNNSLARGSLGAELDERLNRDSGVLVVKRKNDSFRDTGLDEILQEAQVGHLVLTGLDAAGCVDTQIELFRELGANILHLEEL